MKLISNETSREELLKEETLFHVANGYLGVRGNLEEGSDDPKSIRGCYINGFYDSVELSYPERLYGFPQHAQRMINLPDVQDMKIHKESVCDKNIHKIHYEKQTYILASRYVVESILRRYPVGIYFQEVGMI